MWIGGCEGYGLRSGLARKDRIGLNIVRTGKIGVKGLFLEYGEYSNEYSPTHLWAIYDMGANSATLQQPFKTK